MNEDFPNYDGRFAPTAKQLATAIRMARDNRIDSERRSALRLPPPPEKVVSQEERASVKARYEALMATTLEREKIENEERLAAARVKFAKVNEYFDGDLPMDDASIMQRLMGYSVGAPESDEAAT
jgi:hypothetical protein